MPQKDKKVKKNIVSFIVQQVVMITLGFLLPRLYLENFGSEVNGILSTIKQIFTYMTLFEAGIGLAATTALHGLFHPEGYSKIGPIFSAAAKRYRQSGVAYAGVVLVIASVYAFVIPTSISPSVLFFLVILNALPTVFSFFVQAKYRLLLEGEGQRDIITNSETVLQLVSNGGKILVLLLSDSLLLIQLVYCVLSLLQLAFVYIYAKRKYAYLQLKAEPDKEVLANSKGVLIHKISGMVFSNTDVLLLSFLCDFAVVSVYTIYNIFFSQVQTFIVGITDAFRHKLGALYKEDDRQPFLRVYDVYETMYIMATFVVYTLMAVFLLPLIQLYTQGINDANYTNVWLVFLFVMMNLLANGKLPSNHVLEISKQFNETVSHAIWEMVINIAVSVLAILKWGISGAIVGTIVALLYRGTMMIYHANKKVLGRSMWHTYKHWVVNGAVFALVMALFFVDHFSGLSFGALLVQGILHSLWIVPLYIIVNAVCFKTTFVTAWKLWRENHGNS